MMDQIPEISQSISKDKKFYNSILKIIEGNNYKVMWCILSKYKVKVLDEETKVTAIHLALYKNAMSIIKNIPIFSFCEENINYTDRDGLSHLHVACAVGDKDTIRNFLQKGEDINQICKPNIQFSNYTPLHFAVKYDCEETVKFLLDNGANVDATNARGETPLHLAMNIAVGTELKPYVIGYSVQTMETLIKFKCNINASDQKGRTPLFHLFRKNQYKRLDSKYYTIGEKYSNLDRIKRMQKIKLDLLLKCGADVNVTENNGDTILHWVVQNLESTPVDEKDTIPDLKYNIYRVMIQKLLRKGADINALDGQGKSALHYAILYMSIDIVKFLLQNGADVSTLTQVTFENPNLSLSRRRIKTILGIFHMLQAKGFGNQSIQPCGASILLGTAIHWILHNMKLAEERMFEKAKDFYKETIKTFLDEGADVNALNKNGKSILQCAVHYRMPYMVKLLLESNANTNNLKLDAFPRPFAYYKPFLDLPAIEEILDILEILHDKGINLNLSDHLSVVDCFINNKYFNEEAFRYSAHFGTLSEITRSLNNLPSAKRHSIEALIARDLSPIMHIHLDEEFVKKFNLVMQPLSSGREEELNILKSITLGNNVSLYEVLKMNHRSMYHYLRNNEYRRIISSDKFKKLYNFGIFVQGRFAKTLVRQYISETLFSYLKYMLPVNFPEICSDIIMEYLLDYDSMMAIRLAVRDAWE